MNSSLSKSLFFAIILVGMVCLGLVLPKITLATNVKDLGYTWPDDENIPDVCKERYLKGSGDIIEGKEMEFSTCVATGGGALREPPEVEPGGEPEAIAGIVINVVNWIMRIIGALAIAFIVWGGIMYITSAGNEKQIEQAKRILLYAIIGFVISVLAQIILWAVTMAIEAGG